MHNYTTDNHVTEFTIHHEPIEQEDERLNHIITQIQDQTIDKCILACCIIMTILFIAATFLIGVSYGRMARDRQINGQPDQPIAKPLGPE